MSAWYEEAVFYHIYPLGLLGAPRANEGGEAVHRMRELIPWLSHIKELNCTAVYIGPLFESSTHGYDTMDYKKVDRRLGDNDDFRQFVAACHEQGIKVVVDGVFNHTGRDFFAFQDIRQNRENSKYRYWYRDLNFGGNTPYNDGFYYAAWRGCYELANLNLDNEEVRGYLYEVIHDWIAEFDIDGIRLDCADCLNFDFMKEMRRRTAAEKADFWLMGEVIHGDYSRWANPETLHSVTNYELHKGLYSGHNDHNYFEIAHTIRREFDQNGGIYRNTKLYSFVDNHDVDRLASKLTVKENLNPVYTLLYTLPGIPSIYYGSEWGVEGKKEGGNDDPLRPRLDLEEMKKNAPVGGLEAWIRTLGRMKKENPALSYGTYKELALTNRQYAFARMMDDKAVLIAVNNDEQEAEISVPVPVTASFGVDAVLGEQVSLENGVWKVHLAANGSAVLCVG
ncbi:alpha-amylase family glycosyl hydrolase [Diplocloster agilis]|uniref:alpha-amylase family glycosyl hydrolase n=1 Tax=Diplocloster agilis TaxID=2850323 RepID=UPI0008208374|nr:alpha-amylase family glycosyl hydrolase [Suonthocola fibrivorans]MCU6732239.1 alpha-amylase family glycosyl hydrolase [Suonthocola fibrivorans]SCI37906.1 Cyclomaltodextrinase [uncultured Clostridium sp.]